MVDIVSCSDHLMVRVLVDLVLAYGKKKRTCTQKATIYNRDAIDIINECTEDDWIFLDPPYLDRLGYTTGDGGNNLHLRLVHAMKNTKAKWLLIHSDCEFYREMLKDYNIITRYSLGKKFKPVLCEFKNTSNELCQFFFSV